MSDSIKKKILVVDDNEVALGLLIRRLNQKGYESYGISKSLEVVPSLDKNRPDLIILDIFMPEKDGFEITKQLKADEKFRSIPIIGYSAGFDSELEEAKRVGCDDVCLKNGELDPLYSSIEKLIRKTS